MAARDLLEAIHLRRSVSWRTADGQEPDLLHMPSHVMLAITLSEGSATFPFDPSLSNLIAFHRPRIPPPTETPIGFDLTPHSVEALKSAFVLEAASMTTEPETDLSGLSEARRKECHLWTGVVHSGLPEMDMIDVLARWAVARGFYDEAERTALPPAVTTRAKELSEREDESAGQGG